MSAARAADAAAAYEAVGAALRDAVGWRLYTVLAVLPGGAEVARTHSSDPVAYPLRGRKPMGRTPWGAQVLERGEPYLGDGPEAIRWAFPDHALILSLGLGSVINLPVRAEGATLGTINVLDVEGAYGPEALARAAPFAAQLVEALSHAASDA